MAYCGYVTTLKNVRKHSNADRLQLADCFGNTICVNLDYYEGQKVVYFPTDGQLSEEFCEYNNLVRKKDENGNNIGGYMDPDKRNVKCIKLRGETSDGLVLPMRCLDFCFEDGNADAHLAVGDTIDTVNGHPICKKYIPRSNKRSGGKEGNKSRKRKVPLAPLFAEHADTSQLAYNVGDFKPGDEIEITLKVHGTSQRTGYLPVFKGYSDSFWCRLVNGVKSKFVKNYEPYHDGEPIYDWGVVSGTRHTVLDNYDGGFYGSNEFRKQYHDYFDGKLWKGETVYYEVAGFTHTGASIMAVCNNKKVEDKKFQKRYGDTTTFSYGCDPSGIKAGEVFKLETNPENDKEGRLIMKPQSRIFVYRMTMTNEDGNVVEYTPGFMRYRCEQMGVDCVPVFEKFTIGDIRICSNDELETYTISPEDVIKIAEEYYDGPDPIDPSHIREGVVVRILNRPKFTAYKHKNDYFKCIEGIIKEVAVEPDMEEADGLDIDE